MKIKLLITTSVCAFMLSSCSNKQLYQGVQANNKSRCKQEHNEDARQECIKGSMIDYETYERERKKVLDAEGH